MGSICKEVKKHTDQMYNCSKHGLLCTGCSKFKDILKEKFKAEFDKKTCLKGHENSKLCGDCLNVYTRGSELNVGDVVEAMPIESLEDGWDTFRGKVIGRSPEGRPVLISRDGDNVDIAKVYSSRSTRRYHDGEIFNIGDEDVLYKRVELEALPPVGNDVRSHKLGDRIHVKGESGTVIRFTPGPDWLPYLRVDGAYDLVLPGWNVF